MIVIFLTMGHLVDQFGDVVGRLAGIRLGCGVALAVILVSWLIGRLLVG